MNPLKTRLTRSLVLAATTLLAAAGAHAAPTSLIVNGSFESLPVTLGTGQWTVLATLPGWTVDPTSGVEVRNQLVGTAQHGTVFVELDTNDGNFNGNVFDTSTNSWISQQVQTIVGQHYTLSWYYSPRIGEAADTNAIDVLWNGANVATSNGSGMGANAGVWKQFSYDVIGTGGFDTVKFTAAGKADGLGGSLDNVSLIAVGSARLTAAAVPEPGSLALVGLALAALGTLGALGAQRSRAGRAQFVSAPNPGR